MNTNLLAIDFMCANTSAAGPVPAKPAAVNKSEDFPPNPLDNAPFSNDRGTITVDNTFVKPQNGPNKEAPRQFSHTLRKEIATKVPQKANDSRNAKGQNQAVQLGIAQLWLAQYSLNTEQGKEGIARKVGPKAGYELAQRLTNLRPDRIPSGAGKIGPKAGYELAQRLTNLRPDRFLSGAGKTAKPHKNEPLLMTEHGQTGPKAASPKTSNALFATDAPLNQGPNTSTIQSSNRTLLTTKDLTGQENGKELLREALVDAGSKTTTATKKPAIAGKPAVGDGQKVPTLNPSSPPVQDKSPGLQSQLAGLGPEKSPLMAEKAVFLKTNPTQQGQIVSEPLADDGMPANNGIRKGDNSPGNHAFQKLHHPQFQVSTGQIKDRDSSTSNNSSNSGFEQMLSANNAQSAIAEQSSAFPEAAKTDNLPSQTSPSTDSASITEQILESIHSSLRQGDQQISIRLNPPELGKVLIEFKQQEHEITGLLEVSKIQTKYEVEQALPQIIQNLADCGIEIKRLEVMLSDGEQQEQQALKDQSLQDGWAQQQDPANQSAEANNTPANERLTNENSYAGLNEIQEMFVTNHSINILI